MKKGIYIIIFLILLGAAAFVVAHYNNSDIRWLLYAVGALPLSLGCNIAYELLKSRNPPSIVTVLDNPDRWEYKILELSDPAANSDTLNNLGQQGWHLMFVSVGKQKYNKTHTYLFTLKRKLPKVQ